ncbi:MAG: hypothetical protein ACOCUO_01520 [archaeon]
MTKGVFTRDFTPVALPGNVVRLDDGDSREDYRINRLAPFPTVNIGTLTVGAEDTSRNNEMTELEMWDGWLGQYRPVSLTESLPDDVGIQFDQGGNRAPLYELVNERPEITNESLYSLTRDPDDNDQHIESLLHMLELYVWEDENPRVTVINRSDAEVEVDLTYTGFGFQLERVRDHDQTPVQVPVEAIRGR